MGAAPGSSRTRGGESVVSPFRVLLADDDPRILESLGSLLSDDASIRLVGTAIDADHAVRLARETRPHVALLDVRMPGGGPRAAREIGAVSPQTRVVAHSAYQDRAIVAEMLQAGAVGYLVKGIPGDELVETIVRCAEGQAVLSAEVTAGVIGDLVGRLALEREDRDRERETIARIRRVVADGSLTTVFQPIVDMGSGRARGFEALTRFAAEPRRSPDRWFAEAESVGLGTDLEVAAVRAALAGSEDLPPDAFVSINVSPQTAGADRFWESLAGFPLERLVLEVTEQAPVEDYDALNGELHEARARGLKLAVDDAGAGFASLRHVIALLPDFIKIDISITRDVDKDEARRAVAFGLASLASEIGSTPIAEGIESAGELETLRALRIPCGQGYYLSKPLALGDLRGLPDSFLP